MIFLKESYAIWVASNCGTAGIMRQKSFKQMPVIIGKSSDFLPFSPFRSSSLRHGQRRLLSTELHQLSEHCAAPPTAGGGGPSPL
jgi:hypothetical protein